MNVDWYRVRQPLPVPPRLVCDRILQGPAELRELPSIENDGCGDFCKHSAACTFMIDSSIELRGADSATLEIFH